MMFDTSILHDAVNESNEKRYILMFRVWHPDLPKKERNALQFAMDALSAPELISEIPEKRQIAAKQVATMRAFPDLRKLKPKKVPTPMKNWRANIGGGTFAMLCLVFMCVIAWHLQYFATSFPCALPAVTRLNQHVHKRGGSSLEF